MGEHKDKLSSFGRNLRLLVAFLEQDPKLEIIDRTRLENQMSVINAAYNAWKRRQAAPPQTDADKAD